jgi:hypothetical protein
MVSHINLTVLIVDDEDYYGDDDNRVLRKSLLVCWSLYFPRPFYTFK